ncbi:hypothetical protein EDC04DRAFT_2863936 [Pisolithus marmoratus]|nr:hypothetical protein EDC04DRAFT_2863936 [Pisolithus marmoratus]
MTQSIIHILPLELIIRILMMLDYRSLAACRQVCHLFNTSIASYSPLQYTLELEVAGQQDNSLTAWRALQWTSVKDIPMLPGNLWELYGGILAQSESESNLTIRFRRLPSQIREIEEHNWSVSTFDMDLRDFTMDPAQDLLVLIARPRQYKQQYILRSLTTGDRHPLAPDPPILRHSFQVCGDRVAVHFVSHEAAPSVLVVWNWKTGRRELDLRDSELRAISFLANHYILVGGFGDGDRSARLYVLDLTKCDGEPVALEDVNYRYPMSPWVPPASSNVPFFVDRDSRLLVITMYVAVGVEFVSFDLFVLSRALLSFVEGLGPENDRHNFSWQDWGPRNTRLMESPPHSQVWVCFVFGTKFISLVDGESEDGEDVRMLEVWDFNAIGMRRERCQGVVDTMEVEGDPIIEWHDHDSTALYHAAFLENISTSLPCRVVRRDVPSQNLDGHFFADALCSEDNLILVDAHHRNFRLLTF